MTTGKKIIYFSLLGLLGIIFLSFRGLSEDGRRQLRELEEQRFSLEASFEEDYRVEETALSSSFEAYQETQESYAARGKQLVADQKDIDAAKKKLAELEAKPTEEAYQSVQEQVADLPDSEQKTLLLGQLKSVRSQLDQQKLVNEAEKTVKALEDDQVSSRIEAAEKAVTALANGPEKDGLEQRISLVKQAIETRKAQEAAAKATAAASQPQVPSSQAPLAPSNLYFANCSEARANGYSNIMSGTPGYAPHLDRDKDGIGCEN